MDDSTDVGSSVDEGDASTLNVVGYVVDFRRVVVVVFALLLGRR